MREYKFRAWDNEANLMIYSDFRNRKLYDVCYYFETDSKGELKCNWEGEWTESCSPDGGAFNNLMQYTGLKDKNGTEIYEDDIVVGNNGFNQIVKIYRGAVRLISPTQKEFSSFTYGIDYGNLDSKTSTRFRHNPRIYEVIGNIYENPELLNKQ